MLACVRHRFMSELRTPPEPRRRLTAEYAILVFLYSAFLDPKSYAIDLERHRYKYQE